MINVDINQAGLGDNLSKVHSYHFWLFCPGCGNGRNHEDGQLTEIKTVTLSNIKLSGESTIITSNQNSSHIFVGSMTANSQFLLAPILLHPILPSKLFTKCDQ
jgi:hypothetical protein